MTISDYLDPFDVCLTSWFVEISADVESKKIFPQIFILYILVYEIVPPSFWCLDIAYVNLMMRYSHVIMRYVFRKGLRLALTDFILKEWNVW